MQMRTRKSGIYIRMFLFEALTAETLQTSLHRLALVKMTSDKSGTGLDIFTLPCLKKGA